MDAINIIRERGGVALRTSIDMNMIKHERKIELAFEGFRYWDVRRWRTAVNDLSGEFHKSNTYYIKNLDTYGYEITNCQGDAVRVFNEQNYYLPIYQERLFENPNLIQNPGYN
jgi:starch-binding outer membrane protein, SusD/RagB family